MIFKDDLMIVIARGGGAEDDFRIFFAWEAETNLSKKMISGPLDVDDFRNRI